MNRTKLIRNLLLGALVTGISPLLGAGADAAAAGESTAALCQSTFGDRGPTGGSVVGEGPSGDPMSTTIGWDPFDWSDGLREIVTCVSVGGHAAPSLTASTPTPRNDGSLVISLTLPSGEPGSLVCEQSVLVGAGDANGRHRTTSPVCFKLRAGEASAGSDRPAPDNVLPSPAGPPAPIGPPASGPKAPVATKPAPQPASTPPARASFEAARGGAGIPVSRHAQADPDPLVGVAVPPPAWPNPVSAAPAATPGRSAGTAAPAAAPAGTQAGAAAGAPATTLARTGIEDHLALAGGGGLLALGGAAIILAEPRRRRPVSRLAG